MALDKNAFFKYQENRAQSGYRAAFLVRFPGNSYYEMLIASESIPAIVGDTDTFEFDLLNSPVKGRVEGKPSIDDATTDFLYHRDNIYRLSKLKGQVIDCITLTGDFVARKFNATINFRENEASDDIYRGTLMIVAMSASEPILNGRELDIRESLCFSEGGVPESITAGEKLSLSVVQKDAVVTYKEFTISGEDNTESAKTALTAGADGMYTLTKTGLVGIEASAEGYGSWTTTVYVYPAASGASLYSAPTSKSSSY